MKRAHGNRVWRGLVLTAAIGAVAVLAVAGLAAARGHHHGENHRHGPDTGTITAFDNGTGVLTIALNGSGDTFSGLVTRRTKIKCEDQSGLPSDSRRARENEPGDDNGGRGSGSADNSGPGSGSGRGEEEPGDDNGVHGVEPGDDNGGAVEPGDNKGGRHHDDNGVGANCTTADLVAGTVVHEAELDLRNGKAVWDEVELND